MTTNVPPINARFPRASDVGKSLVKLGREAGPYARSLLVNVIGQRRVLQKAYRGVMHALIFWGVTIQVVGTAINLMQMQLFIPFVELPFPRGDAYLAYELLMDVAGVAILIGVLMAAYRRLMLRPKTLETRWDDYYALLLLALIPLVGFTLEGMRLLTVTPDWANWSPVGNVVAQALGGLGLSAAAAASLHPFFFWIHAGLGLLLVASIPFTKLRHLVITPLNVLLTPSRKAGTLSLIEDFEEAESFGVGNVAEFTGQQLLSFDACVRCGRCEELCPVFASGMPYSPRTFVQALRQEMESSLVGSNGHSSGELVGNGLPAETAWYCTTCGACLSACPAFVNPVDALIDMRRYQTLTLGRPPQSAANVLRNLERQGNPWGMAGAERTAWAEGLQIRELKPGEETDVLLFLGCAFAYDDRNKRVAQAFVRLLQKAGVDFAFLGFDETCCGETARRMGEEYLYQMLVEQNIETLSQVKFNRIVTQCPHCFNTLKNEYPQLGGEYQVEHYTEYLAQLSPALNLTSLNGNGDGGRLTYHDPCYLGRYNHVFQEPRNLLDEAELDRVEMDLAQGNSFCCGGGGGQMWMETDADTRINHRRLEQAIDVQADIVATACPYCLLMFDDAIRSQGEEDRIQVMDIAELLAQKAGV